MNGKPWSPEDIATLKREYASAYTSVLMKHLGRTDRSIYAMADKMGLKKSPEHMAKSLAEAGRFVSKVGKATQFHRDQTPWNAGMKGWQPEGCQATQFKKGEMHGAAQRKYVPIGSTRISKDGYLERKVNDDHPPQRRWIGVHRLVWEAANGPIPRGHVVCFLPGRRSADPDKITLDALELVSRAELARRNHPVSRSPELAKLVQLKGAITRQVNRIARGAKESS